MDHLADTAWRMFSEQGLDAVSMEAVATAADVAKATLYKHFPVKGALLAHHIHRELAHSLAAHQQALLALPDTSSRLSAYFMAAADWIANNTALFGPYVRYRMSTLGEQFSLTHQEGRSGVTHIFELLLKQGQQSGELRSDVGAVQLAQYLSSLYLTALTRWLSLPDLDLRGELLMVVDFFMRAAQVEDKQPEQQA